MSSLKGIDRFIRRLTLLVGIFMSGAQSRMSDNTQISSSEELLSALMDGQLSELELRRILVDMSKSDEAAKQHLDRWSRMQLASAVLRKEPVFGLSSSFAERVSMAIDKEEAHSVAVKASAKSSSGHAKKTGLMQGLSKFAVAASVAGGVILGVQQYPQVDITSSAMPAVADVRPVNLPSGINTPGLSARTVAVQSGYDSRPQENQRIIFVQRQQIDSAKQEDVTRYVNRLIQAHTDNAAMSSGQGMLPYTRIILVDDEKK